MTGDKSLSRTQDFDFGSFLLLVLRRIAFLAHGLAAHLDAMGVVHQTVEDAVGDGRIADLLVPARDRQLGSQDGGTGLVATFADLPDFAALVAPAQSTNIFSPALCS